MKVTKYTVHQTRHSIGLLFWPGVKLYRCWMSVVVCSLVRNVQRGISEQRPDLYPSPHRNLMKICNILTQTVRNVWVYWQEMNDADNHKEVWGLGGDLHFTAVDELSAAASVLWKPVFPFPSSHTDSVCASVWRFHLKNFVLHTDMNVHVYVGFTTHMTLPPIHVTAEVIRMVVVGCGGG